jgi:sugar phosphate isomerase/epimerase
VINRRTFLRGVSVAALGASTRGAWGLAKGASSGIARVGLQLYTVRKQMETDFEGTLARVAAIGFKEVEFAGYFNRAPQDVKAILSRNGLDAPSAHVQVKTLNENWQGTIETAHTIGHRYLICAYLFAEERKSLDDYKRLAELFNRAGEEARKAGIQFGYHNHDFEFVKMDGEIPYDTLLRETDPRLVKMELDLYWITKAGYEPEKYFERYPGRFPLFHVKDMDRTPKKFFTEVGRGQIDFKRIFAQSRRAGVKHYFVEQDETPGSPFDSIKVSFDYLKRLEF